MWRHAHPLNRIPSDPTANLEPHQPFMRHTQSLAAILKQAFLRAPSWGYTRTFLETGESGLAWRTRCGAREVPTARLRRRKKQAKRAGVARWSRCRRFGKGPRGGIMPWFEREAFLDGRGRRVWWVQCEVRAGLPTSSLHQGPGDTPAFHRVLVVNK